MIWHVTVYNNTDTAHMYKCQTLEDALERISGRGRGWYYTVTAPSGSVVFKKEPEVSE